MKADNPKRRKNPKRSKGTGVGARKTKLTRLELFRLGKGPTARVAELMHREASSSRYRADKAANR